MDQDELDELLKKAAQSLFDHQPDIYDFTPETGQTEWNLAHHLANEVQRLLPQYSCDLELLKPNHDNRRPDIIFHRRGKHDSNFLVIELKRDGNEAVIRNDTQKILRYWFRPDLHYEFGAVINLKSDKTFEISVFRRPG